MKKLLLLAVCGLSLVSPVWAQETCSEEAKATVDACVDACYAAAPECERQPLTLEEVRAALAEKCPCADARNYGKHRSCVAKLINSLKAFSLIDQTVLNTVKEDAKACRDEIKARGKGNKGNNGKGKGGDDDAPTEQ